MRLAQHSFTRRASAVILTTSAEASLLTVLVTHTSRDGPSVAPRAARFPPSMPSNRTTPGEPMMHLLQRSIAAVRRWSIPPILEAERSSTAPRTGARELLLTALAVHT